MTALRFVKMHGAGNDFIMVDGRDLPPGGLPRTLIAELCARRTGVGADGLIIVDQEGPGAVRMTYFNADGGEADMCGNGARCTVAFAHARGLLGAEGTLLTRPARLAARVHGPGDIEVELPGFRDLALDLDLPDAGYPAIHHCNTGVPHLVIPVDDVAAVEVVAHGRALRRLPRFAPAGVNVNWIAPGAADGEWRLRTYERGVEDETLACGTGASACAVVLVETGRAASPVAVRTSGGDLLTISIDPESRGLRLRGPARVAYHGEVNHG
ncbi:MAG: diaminopimelate epimerase [Candidatus Krumholzibacteriia bacterium]